MRLAGFFTLILLFLVFSLEGICLAEGSDASVIYLQGKEGNITNEPDGTVTTTFSDLPAAMSVIMGDQNNTVPVRLISTISVPIPVAIVFSQNDNPMLVFMNVSHISLNGDDTNLTLTGTPLPFYDGTALGSVTGERIDLSQIKTEQWSDIGVYFEIQNYPPTNWDADMKTKCDICRNNCLFTSNADRCLGNCCSTYCIDQCNG